MKLVVLVEPNQEERRLIAESLYLFDLALEIIPCEPSVVEARVQAVRRLMPTGAQQFTGTDLASLQSLLSYIRAAVAKEAEELEPIKRMKGTTLNNPAKLLGGLLQIRSGQLEVIRKVEELLHEWAHGRARLVLYNPCTFDPTET